jgi:hypothetical protein
MAELDEVLGRAARRVVVVDGDDARLSLPCRRR